jgi:hypothetical protein
MYVCVHVCECVCMYVYMYVRACVCNELHEAVLLEKLIFAQLVKKFPTFMELECLLPCSQEPTTGSHLEPDEYGPQLPTQFL